MSTLFNAQESMCQGDNLYTTIRELLRDLSLLSDVAPVILLALSYHLPVE